MRAENKPVKKRVYGRPFLPGNPDGRAGRRKGQVDATTKLARVAIGKFLDERGEEFTRWMLQIEDPARRCEVFIKLLEFHLPKLTRVEVKDQARADDVDEMFDRLAKAMTGIVEARQQQALPGEVIK